MGTRIATESTWNRSFCRKAQEEGDRTMRHIFSLGLAAAVAASTLSLAAQSSTPASKANPATATKSAQTAAEKTANPDARFVMGVAEGGMAEIELGQLAADKASNAQVKEFGHQMMADHTKMGNELKPLAASKDIMLPTSVSARDKATKDRLAKLSGASFDRAYMAEMVKGHLSASMDFRKEATSGHDPQIKEWAARTLGTVDEHLKAAREIQKELGSPKATQ
jgi:putative membrane protein